MTRGAQATNNTTEAEGSSILDSTSAAGSSDTIVQSSDATIISKRIDSLSDAAFRFRTSEELLTVLERNHENSFNLSGGRGINALHRILKEVDGRVLSDGTVVQASLKGRLSFIPPIEVGESGNTQADLISVLAVAERGLQKTNDRSIPLNIRIENSKCTESFQNAFLRGLIRVLNSSESANIKFYSSDKHILNKVQHELDGVLLKSGHVIRVSSNGELSLHKNYRIGQNGWTEDALRRDITVIKRNLKLHLDDDLKTKVWVPAEEFNKSSYNSHIRNFFGSLRREGLANNLEIRTESKNADNLKGFLRMSTHAVVFNNPKSNLILQVSEHTQISRIENFISSPNSQKPYVVWIKGDHIGPILNEYLVDLRHEYRDDFKVVGSETLKKNAPQIFAPIEDEKVKKAARWNIGGLFKGIFSRFRNSPTE